MAKTVDTYKIIIMVTAFLVVSLSATGAWFYINFNKDNKEGDRSSVKYKQAQIDECMKRAPTFTDQSTLEANYQKKLEYCVQLIH